MFINRHGRLAASFAAKRSRPSAGPLSDACVSLGTEVVSRQQSALATLSREACETETIGCVRTCGGPAHGRERGLRPPWDGGLRHREGRNAGRDRDEVRLVQTRTSSCIWTPRTTPARCGIGPWSFAAPLLMERLGWSKSSIKEGDHLVCRGAPLKERYPRRPRRNGQACC